MLFYTHLLLGVAFFLIIRQFWPEMSTPLFLVLVLFGAVLPDIDEPKSRINRWSGIFGKITTALSKHRGFFHSLLFIVVLYILIYYLFGSYFSLAVTLGFFAHIFGDGLTSQGVTLFYPFFKGRISGPIKTGSLGEKIFMGLLLALVIYMVL